MHTQKEILVLREKKKKTYLREEAGMSFTLPFHINLLAKKTCHFTRSWCTICKISKHHSIHILYTRSLNSC